ncbi:hypothetical protein [Nocardia sp. NPDC050793]
MSFPGGEAGAKPTSDTGSSESTTKLLESLITGSANLDLTK